MDFYQIYVKIWTNNVTVKLEHGHCKHGSHYLLRLHRIVMKTRITELQKNKATVCIDSMEDDTSYRGYPAKRALRMADRALLAGYHRYVSEHLVTIRSCPRRAKFSYPVV